MVALKIPGATGVQALRGDDPQRISAEGRQRASAFYSFANAAESVAGLGRSITEYGQQLEQDEALTESSLRFSEAYNDVTRKEYYTAEEVREMGFDAPNLLNEDMEDRDDVAVWEFAPDVLKKKYDEITDQLAERLSGSGNKQEFRNYRARKGQEMYDRLLDAQRESFFQSKIEKHELAIERAVQLNDPLAITLARTHPDPTKREEMEYKALQGLEVNNIQNAYQSEDVGRMQEMVDYLRDENYNGPLTETQQSSYINMLKAGISELSATETIKRLQPYENARAKYEVALATDDVATAAQTLAEMEAYLNEIGMPEYAEKGYFGKQKAKIAEAWKGFDKNMELQALFRTGNWMAFNTYDGDHTKAADEFVEGAIEQSLELIQAGQASPELYGAVIRDSIAMSSATGYFPKPLKELFTDMNSSAISPEQTMVAMAAYKQLEGSNSLLLTQLDDETRMVLKEASRAMDGGLEVRDAIADVRERYMNASEDTLDLRQRMFLKAQNDARQPMESYLRQRLEGNGWLDWLAPDVIERVFDPTVEAIKPQLGDEIYTQYTNLVRHHMMNGADLGMAQEFALQDWSDQNQLTKINGRWEFMPYSPEAVYGIESDDLRTDLGLQFEEITGRDINEVWDNIAVYPDMITRMEEQPSYGVWYTDENGLPQPMTDSNGEYVRYRPDYEGIKTRNYETALKRAEYKRAVRDGERPGVALDLEARRGSFAERKAKYEARIAREQAERDATGARFSEGRRQDIAEDKRLLRNLEGQ